MKKSKSAILSLFIVTLFSLTATASDVADDALTTFQSNTTAKSSEVNANFSTLKDAVNTKQDKVTGTCPSGQAIREIAADGTITCETDDVGAGDVTSVTAGTGLSGGGDTGDISISIDSNAGFTFFGGDGSAGDLTIDTNTDWTTSPPTNLNYANITINSATTLTVPAGTTIRCTGTFTNNGTISVTAGAKGGNGGLSEFTYPYRGHAHPGDSFGAAGNGGYDETVGNSVVWGLGGTAIPQATARSSFNLFKIGGGGGGAGTTGGDGGGLIKIYCKGAISNTGIISAKGLNGANNAGGGAGGIIILASMVSIDNSGSLQVVGGSGGPSQSWAFAGGGGGGGIIVAAAPSLTIGTTDVTAGIAGNQTTIPSLTYRGGGGGGGASGGDGGNGGYLTGGTPIAPDDGNDGYVIEIQSNPIYLLN
jgi:hypothetical protein